MPPSTPPRPAARAGCGLWAVEAMTPSRWLKAKKEAVKYWGAKKGVRWRWYAKKGVKWGTRATV